VWEALVQTLVALTNEKTLVLMGHGNGAAPGVHSMTGRFYEMASEHFEAACLANDTEHAGCQLHCLVRRSKGTKAAKAAKAEGGEKKKRKREAGGQ
jgi:hypothetical protein